MVAKNGKKNEQLKWLRGFYKVPRGELRLRRLGLLFACMAVAVELFIVFNPPEQMLVSSRSDIVPGGVNSVRQILQVYDSNISDFNYLMRYLHVSRSDIASLAAEPSFICSNDPTTFVVKRQPQLSSRDSEVAFTVPVASSSTTFYVSPLYQHGGHVCTEAYTGRSTQYGWFAIYAKSGDIALKNSPVPLVHAHFTASTCQTVEGYAYDERSKDTPVKVYGYFNISPGNGQPHGPVVADASLPLSPTGKNGFSLPIPDEYVNSTTPVTVQGIMQPLAGWNGPLVQFDNTVMLPVGCAQKLTPQVTCDYIKTGEITRDSVKATAYATSSGGASINGYEYRVADLTGKVITDKTYTTNTSETLSTGGSKAYTIEALALTSLGAKTSSHCIKQIDTTTQCPLAKPSAGSCQACTFNATISSDNPDCTSHIVQSLVARNLTQPKAHAAHAADRIEYTLYTANIGQTPESFTVSDSLSDLSDYSEVVDVGGGNFDNKNNTISWGSLTLQPGAEDARRFVVQITNSIPATPRAANNSMSYDCTVTNGYGNSTSIRLVCPPLKESETILAELPHLNQPTILLMSGAFVVFAFYLYQRDRRLLAVVRKQKHER